MAKSKTTTVIEKELDDSTLEQPVNAPYVDPKAPLTWIETPSEEEEGLLNFLSGLGEGEVVIKIYKFDATTNRPRFMADVGLEGANEAFCQANWGEGRYQLKAYKEGKHQGSRTILVGAPLQKASSALPPPVINIPTGVDPSTQLQLEMFRQEMAMNRDLMKAMIENMGKGDGKSGSMELAEVMVMLKGIMPPASSGPNVLEMITQAIPLVKQLIDLGAGGGAAPVEKGWMGTIKDMMPEIGGILKNVMSARAGGAPPPQVEMQPAPQPYPQNPPQRIAQPEIPGLSAENLAMLRTALDFFKGRAKINADPSAFVGYVLNTLDNEQSLAICKLLERSFEDIAVIDPEILEPTVYRPWFEDFFAELKDAITQRNSPAGEESNDDQPATDAAVSPGGSKV